MNLFTLIKRSLMLKDSVVLGLPEASVDEDPMVQFGRWFEEAKRYGFLMPEAMAVATCTPEGIPSARMVLLKDHDARGFVFFTNYESRKSGELVANPNAALIFHWDALERSVRVEGAVERVSAEESDAYFNSRPRTSQIGARVSRQSRSLPSRKVFDDAVVEEQARFEGQDIPRPDNWGGWRVVPRRIEFWQGRPNRLHDRIVFTRTADGGWETDRLYP